MEIQHGTSTKSVAKKKEFTVEIRTHYYFIINRKTAKQVALRFSFLFIQIFFFTFKTKNFTVFMYTI